MSAPRPDKETLARVHVLMEQWNERFLARMHTMAGAVPPLDKIASPHPLPIVRTRGGRCRPPTDARVSATMDGGYIVQHTEYEDADGVTRVTTEVVKTTPKNLWRVLDTACRDAMAPPIAPRMRALLSADRSVWAGSTVLLMAGFIAPMLAEFGIGPLTQRVMATRVGLVTRCIDAEHRRLHRNRMQRERRRRAKEGGDQFA